MNRFTDIFASLLLVAFFSNSLSAECYRNIACPLWVCCDPCESTIELKGGYFTYADHQMRKMYDCGGIVQLNGSLPLCDLCDGFRLDLYGSIGYLYASGRSTHGHPRRSIWQLPVDLGLKPVFKICQGIELYAAFGPRYFYIRHLA